MKLCNTPPVRLIGLFLQACLCGSAVSAPASAAGPETELQRRLSAVTFEHYAQAPGYSEGPTWYRGELFFCSGGLLRVTAERKVHPHLDLSPAGTFLRHDGHLLICDNKSRCLLELTPDGTIHVLADQYRGSPLRSLNDLTVDARGNIYWTDPEGSSQQTPVGSVFRLRTDGRLDQIATGLAFPNGLDVDPESQFLYVIESQSQKILRYPLPEDTDVCGKPDVFHNLGGSGGDGCVFDAEGNLWVADFHRPDRGCGRITVLSPRGVVLAHLDVPAKVVSNITFGGANHDEIYCTTGDPPGVFRARTGVKGFRGHPGKVIPAVRTLNAVVREPSDAADSLRAWIRIAATARVVNDQWSAATHRELAAAADQIPDATVRMRARQLAEELEPIAARRQRDRDLLAEIQRLKGRVALEVMAPQWLRAIAGDDALDLFSQITEINLNERTDGHRAPEDRPLSQRTTNETLGRLKGQTALRRLELSGTAVTSEGLIHLKDLVNLQYLNLCLTAVSDDGFEHLNNLTRMRRMTVCSSHVTGTGFEFLAGMDQLESINLHSSPASDEGLTAIGKLTSLRRLEIVHTHVTDAGLQQLASLKHLRQLHVHGKHTTADALLFVDALQELEELDVYDHPASNALLQRVGKLPRLRMLRLYGGSFDDTGVSSLSDATSLEELALQSSGVTDVSIDTLEKFKRLRTLSLRGSSITDTGRRRIKSQLPKVRILD